MSSPQHTCMMVRAHESNDDDEERILNATSDNLPFHPSEYDMEEDNREGMLYYPLMENEWDGSRQCHKRDFYLDVVERKDMAHLASYSLKGEAKERWIKFALNWQPSSSLMMVSTRSIHFEMVSQH